MPSSRRIPSILLFLVIVLGGGGVSPSFSSEPTGYVVVLKDDLPATSVVSLSQQIVNGLRASSPSLHIRKRDERTDIVFKNALKGFAVRVSTNDRGSIDALKNHPDVAFVAEDRLIELHGQLFQPGMERIRVRGHQATAINDARDMDIDVDIAILDTGIDSSHPDLNVYRNVSFITGDPGPLDPHGHGTHVAGIAAAIDDGQGVHGVAPGARLWAIKVANEYGSALTSDVLSGLDYVMANADEIDVINMSFGGGSVGDDGACGTLVGDPLHQAVCAVVDAGIVVVVSAGNFAPYGQDASLVSPACYDEVITVSAVTETDGLGPGSGEGTGTFYGSDNSFASSYSNYGWDVDIAAPGTEVASTWPGGGYATETGTSMAAPHVAGAAAVWIAGNQKPTNRAEVLHVRGELVRLGFPQFGPDHGFSKDKETYAEPLLNVAALDPGVFDPVEPRLSPDKAVYAHGQEAEAVISVELKNELGLPLAGIPGNGFQAYLSGRQREVGFAEQGNGIYTLTLSIEELSPGDHDFTVLIRNIAGFERSAGCRIRIQSVVPRLIIQDLAFAWPVMNQDTYFGSNPLSAKLIDGNGAPLLVPTGALDATFSGGGPELVWAFPAPDYVTGVYSGITYGTYQTLVNDVHSLPLGTHHADLSVTHRGMNDTASAAFHMAYNDPSISAELGSNLSRFDFTQAIPPPSLKLHVGVASEWQTGVVGLVHLVDDAFVVIGDNQVIPDVTFSENLSNFGTYVSDSIDLSGLPHGSHELRVQVTDTRGLVAVSNSIVVDVIRQLDACWDPSPGEGQADSDGDGDGLRDACDNCPNDSNRSQRSSWSDDAAEAELGDACRTRAGLSVSSSPADNADFVSIQDAVDQAAGTSPQVVIEILPGIGSYLGSVVVDRGQTFAFVGKDLGSGPPVLEHGGGSDSIFDFVSSGDGSIVVRNLVLQGRGISDGGIGISAGPGISTDLSNLRFEGLATGIDLQSGTHRIDRVFMDGTVGSGLIDRDGTLWLHHSEFRGTRDAVRISGASAQAEILNLLIVGNGIGKGIDSSSTATSVVEVRHSTLVDCGIGIHGNGNGTTITHSILSGNHGDVSGVSCERIDWSSLEDLSCGGTNVTGDPLFVDAAGGDFHLRATSPLLDHGPPPGDYTGSPCSDLDDQPRLRDHDGDGLARIDPGAYERMNTAIAPKEVHGLIWTSPTMLEWTPSPTSTVYHVYRDDLSALGYSSFGTCEDQLESTHSDTRLSDETLPLPGEALFYSVTVEDSFGRESSLGAGSCAERSNFDACP